MNNPSLKKTISAFDVQYQLKAYHSLLEQYQEHFNDIPQKYIPQSYEILKNHIVETQTYLQQYYEQTLSYRHILNNILGRNIDTIANAARQYSELKTKFNNMLQNIDDKEMCLQDFKQKFQKSQIQVENISVELENLRNDNIRLQHKIQQRQKQIENDRNQIRKTFITVQQESEQDKQMVQQLFDTQENLRQQIVELTSQKQFFQKKQAVLQQQLSRSGLKIAQLQNQIECLTSEIENIKISDEYNEQQYKIRKFSAENEQDGEEFVRAMSFNQNNGNELKNKLSDDVDNYKIPIMTQSFRSYARRSQDQLSDVVSINHSEYSYYHDKKIQENEKTNVQQNQKPKRNFILDPYFSHYILTSQSIKIKEDCEDMLNIDMKPFYKQVIQKRIPMHLWDQWIKNRLRELTKRKF